MYYKRPSVRLFLVTPADMMMMMMMVVVIMMMCGPAAETDALPGVDDDRTF